VSDKRKKREYFDDSFEVDDFGDVEDILDYIMGRLGMDMSDISKKSFISGFSMSNRHPGGSMDNRDNISIGGDSDEYESHQMRIKDPSPLIDIFEIEDQVHVIAELPGVDKGDIELNLTVSSLEIKVSRLEKGYSEVVDLPETVNPESARATYINGILELIADKMEFGKARKVIIE
jgi:HSP20 family protein